MKIYNLFNELIFENSSTTMKDTVDIAIAVGAKLQCADLVGADLHKANMRGAWVDSDHLQYVKNRGAYNAGTW